MACCSSCGRKESDTTERLKWTELKVNASSLSRVFNGNKSQDISCAEGLEIIWFKSSHYVLRRKSVRERMGYISCNRKKQRQIMILWRVKHILNILLTFGQAGKNLRHWLIHIFQIKIWGLDGRGTFWEIYCSNVLFYFKFFKNIFYYGSWQFFKILSFLLDSVPVWPLMVLYSCLKAWYLGSVQEIIGV